MRHIQSVFVLVLVGSAAALLAAQTPPGTPYDVVVHGGRVHDGMGNPWIRADVAISEGRIAAGLGVALAVEYVWERV